MSIQTLNILGALCVMGAISLLIVLFFLPTVGALTSLVLSFEAMCLWGALFFQELRIRELSS